MKQILQNLGSGETILADVPAPRATAHGAVVRTSRTLVSLGTEKMLLDFGRAGWLAKARQQPEKVKQVLQKIKTDGLWTTIDAVRAKLDQPIPLGYCNVGVVSEVGQLSSFQVGDRVVSNGPHAELVSVSPNLAAKIPDSVTDDEASFTVVGAIALQGIRLLAPTLGERIVVSGLGLIGLLAVQILRANGCQVLGIDFDPQKLALARAFGAETVDLAAGQDPVAVAEAWTRGIGVDGVLITASTKSDELIHQAATMCRQRGRIVLVGVIGLQLRRSDFYEKEISFQVSCSYGPGRYDESYEKLGLDYPIGFARWTEQRNFEAILALMADGQIDVKPLISHRFPFESALEAYEVVGTGKALGILLEYSPPSEQLPISERTISVSPVRPAGNQLSVSFLGAGGFATRMLLPAIGKHGVRKRAIVSSGGVTASHAAKKFGFELASTDVGQAIHDPNVDAIFICTPHNSHASLVAQALSANKHVFVEKPLALNLEELEQVQAAVEASPDRCLMVGFNRRFSPHTVQLKRWLAAYPGSKSIIITVNAGEIPADHWTQNPAVGGGRILGEGCHFIDLARFLAGSSIVSTHSQFLGGAAGRLKDSASIQLAFEDGSLATIQYLSQGHKSFPKERVEVFAGGDVLACENFRVSSSLKTGKKFRTRVQDKGHQAGVDAFMKAIKEGGTPPVPLNELIEVTKSTIQAAGAATGC